MQWIYPMESIVDKEILHLQGSFQALLYDKFECPAIMYDNFFHIILVIWQFFFPFSLKNYKG